MRKKTRKNGTKRISKHVPKEIRVIIAGGVAAGKTTLMQLFAKALADAGITFELSQLNHEPHPIVCDCFQMQRIEGIKGRTKTKVVLEERRTYTSIDTSATRERMLGVRE